MRLSVTLVALVLGAVVLLPACATDAVTESSVAYTGDPAARPMGPELFPLEPSTVEYVLPRGRRAQATVEPTAEGARMWLRPIEPGAPDVPPREITVRRREGGLWFANGPSYGVALIRFGVGPGARWTGDGMELVFEGWERIETPAGVYDAARVRTVRGKGDIQRVETWWFAPDVGLVRLETDAAGLFTETLERVTR